MGNITHKDAADMSTADRVSAAEWKATATHLIGGVASLDIVTTAETQTLTNKTLTSPTINTPTGIVKGDVGLGNVENTAHSTDAHTMTIDGVDVSAHAAAATGVHGITDWATYTPAISSAAGTPTTVTATGRWRLIGDTMLIKATCTITDKGDASGYMRIALPSGYTNNQGITVVLQGAEVVALGALALAFIANAGSYINVGTSVGGSPWTNTYTWAISGEFKVAYA